MRRGLGVTPAACAGMVFPSRLMTRRDCGRAMTSVPLAIDAGDEFSGPRSFDSADVESADDKPHGDLGTSASTVGSSFGASSGWMQPTIEATGEIRVTMRTDAADQEDRALLVFACDGDERAFGHLIDHHQRGLAVLCHLMLADPITAESVMTEAAITAWRERDVVELSTTVRVWLYRIAVRLCQAADPSPMSSDHAGRLT
jgi:hypothetical protein